MDRSICALSTQPAQPVHAVDAAGEADIVAGGYWYAPPEPGAGSIVAMGAVTPEAIAAHESVVRDFAGAGLLVLTSPDRLHRDWLAQQRKRGHGRPHRNQPTAP